MNIQVTLTPNQITESKSITLEDLCVSESEWVAMGEDKQKEVLQEYINDLPEQPYWMVDTFKTEGNER